MQDPYAHVRMERSRPSQIRAALAQCPVVYMPLGTYEYHQEHLPIGLDSLTAQGICLSAASEHGGMVCPPLYYGTGGDHSDMPFTVMLDDDKAIRTLIEHSLHGWMRNGAKLTVLLSGHFANEQVAMVKDIAEQWNAQGHSMQVLGLAMNMGENIPMKPDHAGLFETTLLSVFCPETVDMAALPPVQPGVDPDQGKSPYGRQRLDPLHPLWGIMGPDPRPFEPSLREPLFTAMMRWFNGRVQSFQTAHS